MTAKKDPRPQSQKKADVTASSTTSSTPVDNGPQTIEEAIERARPQIEEALKNVPPEKLAEAKRQAEQLMTGDLSWADLTQYTPEKQARMAEAGFNQFRMGQYDSSEKIFKGLTVIDPENFYYHQMLGATFQRKDKFAEAILEYSIAADLNPKDLVSITNRGEIYFKLGIMELANADFDKAIAMDPGNEDKWANRARMLREQIRLMKQRGK